MAEAVTEELMGGGEMTTMPLSDITGNTTVDPFWDQIYWAHPYWKQFDIPGYPDWYHWLVGFYMTVVCPIGVISNLVVIYVFSSTKHLRTPPNMLIVNLACSDCMFAAMNGFPILTVNSIFKIWRWGKICCIVYGFNGGLAGFVSICTLAVIAFDRWYVISNPMKAAHTVTKKKTLGYIIMIWVYSAIWAVPPLFGWGQYNLEGLMTSCTFDYLTQDLKNYSFNAGMFIGAFGVPMFFICFFYIGIVKAIMKHHDEMQAQAQKMGAKAGNSEKDREVEIKMTKIAATTIALYLLSWGPYAVVTGMGLIYPHDKMMVTPLMAEIPVMLAKTSSIWNPIIYAISHPKFRAEVDKRFPWMLMCCGASADEKAAAVAKKADPTRTSVSKTEDSEVSQTMNMSSMDGGANPAV